MRRLATSLGVISLCWFTLSDRATGGGPVKDPIQDYLHLSDHDQAIELPVVKGISVLELDISGDGRREIFVSADGYGGRLGNSWTVYLSREDGFERLSAPSKDAMFRLDMFYVGEVETPDGGKIRGLLVYYPGKGGGDLAIYQVANDYVVRTSLGSLNLEEQRDRAFWDKYFAGPSEDQPYRSLIDHPAIHRTTKELAQRGYDLTAVDRLNVIRNSDPKSAQTSDATSTPSATSSPPGPIESPPKLQQSTKLPSKLEKSQIRIGIVIALLILSTVVALYLKKRR